MFRNAFNPNAARTTIENCSRIRIMLGTRNLLKNGRNSNSGPYRIGKFLPNAIKRAPNPIRAKKIIVPSRFRTKPSPARKIVTIPM